MIHFYNITFDEDWVYAERAYDYDFKAEGSAKISRHSDEFYTDCPHDNFFKRGMIVVRRDIERGKLGQHSERVVAWC